MELQWVLLFFYCVQLPSLTLNLTSSFIQQTAQAFEALEDLKEENSCNNSTSIKRYNK